jgi:hypothetical protein
VDSFPLVDNYLRQLSKKHISVKAAVLPAEGLLSYFSVSPQSLENLQDQVMAIVAFFGCLRGCELVNIELSQVEEVQDGIMTTIT